MKYLIGLSFLEIVSSLLLAAAIAGGRGLADEAIHHDRVDLVEVNHCYDEAGDHRFDQVIFYEWTGDFFAVVAWRMLDRRGLRPIASGRKFVATWSQGDRLFRVVSPAAVETWTQYDPEQEQRDLMPEDLRRGLYGGARR